MISRKDFFRGAFDAAPIYLVNILVFSATGMLARQHDLSLIQSITMTATIFAAPMQAFMIENTHLSLWVLAINCILMNFKFGIMSAALLSMLKYSTPILGSALFFVTSSIFLLTSSNMKERAQSSLLSYYFGVAIPGYLTAILSSGCGYIFYDYIQGYKNISSTISHIILPLYFSCLTAIRYIEWRVVIATLIGFLLTATLSQVIGKEFLVIIWFGIAFILVISERKECGKQLS